MFRDGKVFTKFFMRDWKIHFPMKKIHEKLNGDFIEFLMNFES